MSTPLVVQRRNSTFLTFKTSLLRLSNTRNKAILVKTVKIPLIIPFIHISENQFVSGYTSITSGYIERSSIISLQYHPTDCCCGAVSIKNSRHKVLFSLRLYCMYFSNCIFLISNINTCVTLSDCFELHLCMFYVQVSIFIE